ncbi:ATPase, V0 complex, subunit E1/e2 [Amanita rubescens]|nr:ATPase, V0 complex, subunit E1/e2 [Amanita rubescens]
MASIFPILFVGVIVITLMFLAAVFTPKGPNQVVVRTFLMLTLACCYLMWMVTYLAQLHPLVCA